MTKRQQILNQLKGFLRDGEAKIAHVEINRPTAPALETIPFPAAFIYSMRSSRAEDGVVHDETFIWEVFISIWTKGDGEEFIGAVHRTLATDAAYTLNGIADWSKQTDNEPLTVDADRNIKSFLLTYEVRYNHPLGET